MRASFRPEREGMSVAHIFPREREDRGGIKEGGREEERGKMKESSIGRAGVQGLKGISDEMGTRVRVTASGERHGQTLLFGTDQRCPNTIICMTPKRPYSLNCKTLCRSIYETERISFTQKPNQKRSNRMVAAPTVTTITRPPSRLRASSCSTSGSGAPPLLNLQVTNAIATTARRSAVYVRACKPSPARRSIASG